jgi:3-dehydroquinate synthetase
MDKKVRGKAVNFVLPVKIGETRTMSGIDEGEIEFALEKIGGK